MSQYAFGHATRIKGRSPSTGNLETLYFFQNFYLNQEATHTHKEGDTNKTNQYRFVPFGFSGVTVNRTGDGLEATLVFPNNGLSRGFADQAIDQNWVMEVDVLILDADNPAGTHQKLHSFTGQAVGGQWDNVSLNLKLSSVLDAVGTDVPRRSLTQRLVGNLPISNNVRLQ
nr:putative phage minor tail protein [uncultured Mediterranean phage uvMED]